MKPESVILAHIFERSRGMGAAFPRVVVGPGDDCAALRIGDDARSVALLTVDQLVEGRHYDAANTTLDLIGRKAIARSVSDIAAMGGTPIGALATGALRDGFAHEDELFDSMARWAAHWNCPLIGGDVARVAGPTVLTTHVVGLPHGARGPVLRSGARPGDGVYVTGALGGSLDGNGLGRHLEFEPRVEEGIALCDALGPRLSAMIDVSDGLGRDAARVAKASGVRIEIDAAAVPLAPRVTDWRCAFDDGEDYELCFCAGAEPPRVVSARQTRITRIGVVTEGEGCVVRTPEGGVLDVSERGWDHGA